MEDKKLFEKKDLSAYTYTELYDMLNHINPYKYHSRIELVQIEIEKRKKSGEVPKRLVPQITFSFSDVLDFGLVLYSVQQLLYGIAGIILSVVIGLIIADKILLTDLILCVSLLIVSVGLVYGGFKIIKKHLIGVFISFYSLLLQIPVIVLMGTTMAKAFEVEPTPFSMASLIPVADLLTLLFLFYIIRKEPGRSARGVF